MSKKFITIISVIVGILILAGLGVLIWWLVTDTSNDKFETILLEGDGLGQVKYNAAFTRIYGAGDIFWWFFPSTSGQSRPILLFLGGITGIPDSFLLNFGGIGPLDFNLNARNTSLVSDYHLLFVDSLIGTGFSQPEDKESILTNMNDMVDNLKYTLESFYGHNDDYEDAPLYIYAQGDASLLAIPLATQLVEDEDYSDKLKGIFLGNPIISPALTLTNLGFYLEELAYVDGDGRAAIEEFSSSLSYLVSTKNLEEAFDQFLSLGEFINEKAGAVAVNMGYIVEKLTRNSVRDYFGQSAYLNRVIPSDIDMKRFMKETVGPALGISNDINYDGNRDDVVKAFRPLYMEPIVDKVENILNNSDVRVTIFNGNLDAVSNTPGQLEWVDHLNWYGRTNFTNSERNTLVINRQIEGYFRESGRLNFYWINVAGQSTLLDNPVGTKKMLERITRET
ncbi:unnamed protein product [Colias eurytheme]|nr:unnamed protein product [Colias eurytheme]